MWIVTGIRSSAAVAHSGSRRGSSTATSRPSASRARSPSVFQTLRPRAPAATPSRSRPASASPKSASPGQRSYERPAKTATRPARGTCQRSISRRRSSPAPPSRSTSASTPAASRIAASSALDRVGQSAPKGAPRWLCPSMTGNRGRATSCSGDAQLAARSVVRQAQVGLGRCRHPLRPLTAIPRTNSCWARTNRMIIGARLTRAPAIISGHLPTNWPWKSASPTVVVYCGRSRR